MAELLPSLSSDEEGQLEGESEDEEFEANENFEFGGILVRWCKLFCFVGQSSY